MGVNPETFLTCRKQVQCMNLIFFLCCVIFENRTMKLVCNSEGNDTLILYRDNSLYFLVFKVQGVFSEMGFSFVHFFFVLFWINIFFSFSQCYFLSFLSFIQKCLFQYYNALARKNICAVSRFVTQLLVWYFLKSQVDFYSVLMVFLLFLVSFMISSLNIEFPAVQYMEFFIL